MQVLIVTYQWPVLHWLPFQMTPSNLLNCFFPTSTESVIASLWGHQTGIQLFWSEFPDFSTSSGRRFLLSWQSSWTNNSSLNPLKIKFLLICGLCYDLLWKALLRITHPIHMAWTLALRIAELSVTLSSNNSIGLAGALDARWAGSPSPL